MHRPLVCIYLSTVPKQNAATSYLVLCEDAQKAGSLPKGMTHVNQPWRKRFIKYFRVVLNENIFDGRIVSFPYRKKNNMEKIMILVRRWKKSNDNDYVR